jgi:hypothetical protein
VTLSVSNRSSWHILSIPAEASASVSRAEVVSDSIFSVLTTNIESTMKVLVKLDYTCTDLALALPSAFLSVEFSRSQLASAVPPFVSVYSPECYRHRRLDSMRSGS